MAFIDQNYCCAACMRQFSGREAVRRGGVCPDDQIVLLSPNWRSLQEEYFRFLRDLEYKRMGRKIQRQFRRYSEQKRLAETRTLALCNQRMGPALPSEVIHSIYQNLGGQNPFRLGRSKKRKTKKSKKRRRRERRSRHRRKKK